MDSPFKSPPDELAIRSIAASANSTGIPLPSRIDRRRFLSESALLLPAIAGVSGASAFAQTAPGASRAPSHSQPNGCRAANSTANTNTRRYHQLVNGDLFRLVGGDGEYAANTGVYGTRLAARYAGSVNAGAWSSRCCRPRPFRAVGNPVVWQVPPGRQTGLVLALYVVRFGETWIDGRIAAKVSSDGARTWSDTSLLTLERGTLVRGKPIVLRDGRYLLPVYREAGEDREFVGEDTASFCLFYDPAKREWTRGGDIVSRLGNLQPAPAEVAPGRLIAFCRRGGGYGDRPDAWMVYAESSDAGLTWSAGHELVNRFPNPNAVISSNSATAICC